MKKIIILSLVLSVLLSMPLCTAAVVIPSQEGTYEDPTSPLPTPDSIQPCEPCFIISTPLNSGESKVITECRVTQGETMLHITNATWYPAMDIEIGFRSQTTLIRYKVDFSNGSITDFGITTPNVPSGSYYVYIKNNGVTPIGSGTFYYELTG